jgi:hypothetical protein
MVASLFHALPITVFDVVSRHFKERFELLALCAVFPAVNHCTFRHLEVLDMLRYCYFTVTLATYSIRLRSHVVVLDFCILKNVCLFGFVRGLYSPLT